MIPSKSLLVSLFLGCLVLPQAGAAATLTPASLAAAAVQSTINSASDGDTILLPAGSATWTTPVKVQGKSLVIKGAGIGQTIITHGLSEAAWQISGLNTKYFSLSDFTIVGSDGCTYGAIALGANVDTNLNWRIHHIRFTNISKRGMFVNSYAEGVIDNCIFDMPFNLNAQAITVFGDGSVILPRIPGSWTRPLALGSAKYVFVEDCTINSDFPNDAALEGYVGARFVFRNNYVTNAAVGAHGLDSSVSSTHSYEIYNNTFVVKDKAPSFVSSVLFFQYRGGTGVIFNNNMVVPSDALTKFPGNIITLYCYRATGNFILANGMVGGAITGANPLDGNQDGWGWPTCQQVGTTSPLVLNGTNSSCTLAPVYQWNNTLNGGGSARCSVGPSTDSQLAAAGVPRPYPSDVIKANRDYYDNVAKPGYSSYTYPHPLRSYNPSNQTSPSAPSDLRVVAQ